MAADGLDVEAEVLQHYVKLCDRILIKSSGQVKLTKAEMCTLSIMKWYAQRKLDSYEATIRKHKLEDDLLSEIRTEFPFGYFIFGLFCLSILLIIYL